MPPELLSNSPQGSLRKPKPPLCKGRWRGAAVSEGLERETIPLSANADISLYTRGTFFI